MWQPRQVDSGDIKSIGISTSRTRLALYPIKEGYYLLVAMERKKPMGRAFFECKRAGRKIEQETA
jgi:predicted regulator of Ras-like GTPase activity (Roadblock/LC7/MglB family)